MALCGLKDPPLKCLTVEWRNWFSIFWKVSESIIFTTVWILGIIDQSNSYHIRHLTTCHWHIEVDLIKNTIIYEILWANKSVLKSCKAQVQTALHYRNKLHLKKQQHCNSCLFVYLFWFCFMFLFHVCHVIPSSSHVILPCVPLSYVSMFLLAHCIIVHRCPLSCH